MRDDDSIFGEPVLWRDTIRSPRLLIFDARLIFFCALIVLHFRLWTLITLLVGVLLFWLIERAGLRFPSALRALRSRLAGASRPAIPSSQYRFATTTAFEGHPLISRPDQPRRKTAKAKTAERDEASELLNPAE